MLRESEERFREEALRRREAILEAVTFAAEQFLKTVSWEENIQKVLARLGQATGVSRVYIFENHTDQDGTLLTSQRYEWVAPGIESQIDLPELQNFPWRAGGFGRWVDVLSRDELIYGHVREFPAGEREVLTTQGIRSIVAVPIFTGQTWWGFIGFDECLVEREWSAAEMDALRVAAGTLGAAIQRQRAEEERQARERYVELLNDITHAAIKAWDFQIMVQVLADRLGELLGADGCYITLWNEEQERVIPAAASGPLRETYRTLGVEPGEVTMTESVLRAGHALIAEDVFNTPHLSPRIAALFPARSLLGLPLIVDGQKLGAVLIAFNQPHHFTPDEIARGEQAARQIALAVAKAQLLEAEREQRQLAEALREAGTALTTILDLETIPDRLLDQIARVVPYDAANVMLVEEGHIRVTHMRGYDQFGADVARAIANLSFEVAQTPNLRHMAETGRPLVISDTAANPEWIETEASAHLRSWAGAPIIVQGEVVAFFSLDKAEPGFYRPEHAERLAAFAGYAALAMENARLFKAAQRRAREAETLRRAGAVVAATLDLNDAIQRILEQLEQVVPYESASVQLLHEGYLEIVGGRGWADLAEVIGLRFPVPGDNPNTLVIQERRPHILDDAPAVHAPFREAPHSHIRSWLGVPLIVRNRVIGMLTVDSTRPHHFTSDHARLAAAFADQVAIALENARLFEAERRRTEELEALRQASLRLTSSLELQPVLEAIVNHALELVAANDVHIFLYDGEHLSFGAALWADGRQETPYIQPRPGGLTHTVARSGERIVIPDVNRHPLFQDWQWGGAIAGLPLRVGDRTCGVMNVAFDRPHAFSEDELRVLELLADQAAIAIRNAQLHAEVQELALTDDLTGLYNRRGLFELGQREVERAHRFGRPLTAMMFDLDHFKRVNDAYGHTIGDQVLAGLAARCQQELREVDLLGRYGGEEFGALLPEADLATAHEVAERLREAVAQTAFETDVGLMKITISIGVAALGREDDDLETLLRDADQALYAAKQAGRNRVAIWPVKGEGESPD